MITAYYKSAPLIIYLFIYLIIYLFCSILSIHSDFMRQLFSNNMVTKTQERYLL